MAPSVNELMTHDPRTVSPDDPVVEAARVMREDDVRRLAVVQDSGGAVGIVSIGDFAIALDDDSALADIGSDPPKN